MLKASVIFVMFYCCLVEAAVPYFLEGCPYIQLKGKLDHSVLPGAPNYESIKEGDVPSERWFIYPNESSMEYLRESGVFETIPENYRPIDDWKEHVHCIQLAASGKLENEFEKKGDQEVVLEGWLGSWPTHCYSVFFFEVVKIN